MSQVKLSSASPEEIEAFAATLKTAGYLVAQVSPQELEIRPPVPEYIATARLRVLAEQELALMKAEEPVQCADVAECDVVTEAEFDSENIAQREFILAPIGRRLTQLFAHVQFGNRIRIMIEATSEKSSQLWYGLALGRRWRKASAVLSLWRAAVAERVHSVAVSAREPKQVKLVVEPAPPRNVFDRIGWAMTGVLSLALILVVALGSQMNSSSAQSQSAVMQPAIPQAMQPSATTSSSSLAVVPSASAKQKPQAARANRGAQESGGQEVIVRHFRPQKTQSQLRPVAGVKHFSDMDQ